MAHFAPRPPSRMAPWMRGAMVFRESTKGHQPMNLFVTKRNGHKEPIDLDKIHRVLDWAAEKLDNVSVSQVELKSHIQFYDGIRTADIHETVIKAAADLISEQSPDYQYMAARLAIFHLRKKAYGQFEPPHLYQHVARLVDMGKYDKHLLTDYTQAEFEELNGYLDHWRDMDFSYAAVKQLEGKYLVQNRVTGEIYESPQFLYILVAACLFSKYPKDTRLDYIKRFYDAVSTFKISLPTPIMSGVRTPTRQFSSCVLIECDDSLDSINATASAIVRYVSQRAGIIAEQEGGRRHALRLRTGGIELDGATVECRGRSGAADGRLGGGHRPVAQIGAMAMRAGQGVAGSLGSLGHAGQFQKRRQQITSSALLRRSGGHERSRYRRRRGRLAVGR